MEYELEGIGQTQVNTRVDMSFARGLRAILRQDPDVVMVGKFVIQKPRKLRFRPRSQAIWYSQHSTLTVHQAQSPGYATWASNHSCFHLHWQGLSRNVWFVVCVRNADNSPVSPQQAQMFKYHQLAVTTIGTPVGCPHCHQSGYQGRMAIHEMMVVTPELRAAIHENVDEQALERLVRQQHNALIKNGLQTVIRGDTSWDEVMRVASATLENKA